MAFGVRAREIAAAHRRQPAEIGSPRTPGDVMPAPEVDLSTLVVAIDGPSGSGKSTLARGVGRELGLRYLDTGAMYRALTWWVLHTGTDPADEQRVLAAAATFRLEISAEPDHQLVRVHGHDITTEIRSIEVTRAVSAVSAIPAVRRQLVSEQRAIVAAGGIVVEGRDIGTAVCPAAPVKIFLTAAADTRAARRAREVEAAGGSSRRSVDAVRADLDRRDHLDSHRVASPLNQAPDAVVLDTTNLDANQAIAVVLTLVHERTGLGAKSTIAAGSVGTALHSIGGERR
jgi:CMP/dCMP kinase